MIHHDPRAMLIPPWLWDRYGRRLHGTLVQWDLLAALPLDDVIDIAMRRWCIIVRNNRDAYYHLAGRKRTGARDWWVEYMGDTEIIVQGETIKEGARHGSCDY